MADEDAEAIKAFSAGLADGNPAVLWPLDPDVEWNVQDDLPDAGTWRGHAGVEEFFAGLREVWDPLTFETVGVERAGDRVLLTVRQIGYGAGSRTPVEQLLYAVFGMRDGRAVRMDVFFSPERARAAAGLE